MGSWVDTVNDFVVEILIESNARKNQCLSQLQVCIERNALELMQIIYKIYKEVFLKENFASEETSTSIDVILKFNFIRSILPS